MKNKIIQSFGEVDMSHLKWPTIAVYKDTKDFPGKYIARIFDVDRATDTIMIKDTFMEIQQDIRRNTNMVFIVRHPDDDPVIMGAWI